MTLWKDALTVKPEALDEHLIFVCENGADLLGFYSIKPTIGYFDLDHFWVLPLAMGMGTGRKLFLHALQMLARADPGAILRIESDPNAEGFYLRMGAARIGTVRTEWQGVTRSLPLLEYRI